MSLKLRKVVLRQEISISDVYRSDNPEERFDASLRDTFVTGKFDLSRDGDDVTISGNAGTVTLPWSSVLYAVSEREEVKPVVSAGKAGKR